MFPYCDNGISFHGRCRHIEMVTVFARPFRAYLDVFQRLPFPRLIPWSMLRPCSLLSCICSMRGGTRLKLHVRAHGWWLVVLMLNPESKYWQAHQPHCALYTLLNTLVYMRTHRPTERETEFISAAQLFKM